MKIERVEEAIVCDVPGCGRLAKKRLSFTGGGSAILCDECFGELKRGIFGKGEKSEERKR